MFQKINEAYETRYGERKVYDMELKGGGGDISELDDILKCFFGGMGGGMHHMQQFSNMGGGEGGGNGSSIYGTTCRIRKRRRYGRTEYFRV
jgi:hypothetical protein